MVFEWAYSGVNKSVPRNAGAECANYLDPTARNIETVIVVCCTLCVTYWGYSRLSLKSRQDYRGNGKDSLTVQYCNNNHRIARRIPIRKVLLMVMSLIWGMEIGYKFSSRTVIYLLNPCHVTTAIQIYLLAAAPSNFVTAIFRVHMNFMNGPLLAFLFPETDTRVLPLEAAIYWIQHGMMVVVPYYLLRLGGVYNMERMSDWSWNAFGYGLNALYHICVLQAIAIPTQVNLNHMLCPAILDPFSGPHYRKIGFIHQAILCPLLCKLLCFVATYNRRTPPVRLPNHNNTSPTPESQTLLEKDKKVE